VRETQQQAEAEVVLAASPGPDSAMDPEAEEQAPPQPTGGKTGGDDRRLSAGIMRLPSADNLHEYTPQERELIELFKKGIRIKKIGRRGR
ncbi:unnamed protein product, partial [Heterosigma akashiwo]